MQRQNVFFCCILQSIIDSNGQAIWSEKSFLRKWDFWKCGATLISELLRKDAQIQNQPEHIPRDKKIKDDVNILLDFVAFLVGLSDLPEFFFQWKWTLVQYMPFDVKFNSHWSCNKKKLLTTKSTFLII
jgi:hypothetical protein